jgi:hypothetical protein
MRRQLSESQRAETDARRARFREIVKQVAEMSDAERDALAAKLVGIVTCDGHSLSVHNVRLVAMQIPTATIVGGFRQWLKHGRAVRKGEHGATIWVPVVRKSNADDGKGGPDETRFMLGTIFDVSQTEPVEAREPVAA